MSGKIYKSRTIDGVKAKVTEVKKDRVIKTEQYGDVLVTKGNYVLEFTDKANKGVKIGITPQDLDLQYEPVKK